MQKKRIRQGRGGNRVRRVQGRKVRAPPDSQMNYLNGTPERQERICRKNRRPPSGNRTRFVFGESPRQTSTRMQWLKVRGASSSRQRKMSVWAGARCRHQTDTNTLRFSSFLPLFHVAPTSKFLTLTMKTIDWQESFTYHRILHVWDSAGVSRDVDVE